MYEPKTKPLLSRNLFLRRVGRHLVVVVIAITFALSLGVTGYHFIAGLPWIDSLLNASMILGGMGPVDTLTTNGAKIFASFYALFSGLVFIGIATAIAAPFLHRLMHHFHIQEK